MDDLFSDRVIRSIFALALGIAFTVFCIAAEHKHNILIAVGIVWSLASLYWVIKEVKDDWNNS